MKHARKTLLFTLALSFIAIVSAVFIQIRSQNNLLLTCSYLDPITIDIVAFLAGFFLIIEGIHRIVEHKNMPLKKQITRSIRIAFGCAIITLHIMQFIHK